LEHSSRVRSRFTRRPRFTYQGRLQHGDTLANGLYEMSFALHDAATNGNVVGTPVTVAPVPVSNGLFTVTLDFGAAPFMGAERWLEIAVTVFGSDQPVVTLVPRQPLTPAPYALHAHNAAGLMSFANAPLDIKVNGQRAFRLEASLGFSPNVIGGASVNAVDNGAFGATIGGGGYAVLGPIGTHIVPNRVTGNLGTVSGGANNTAASGGTVGGGFGNNATGEKSFVGGGENNTAGREYSTIGGGELTGLRASMLRWAAAASTSAAAVLQR